MIRIDENLLVELGLAALPQQEKQPFLRHIYETLEMRVGMKLAEQMTDAQLDEFESFIDSNNEAGALKWLETNFPNYKQVVVEELDKLKLEIKSDAPKILAAYQQQAADMQQQPQVQQPQVQPQVQPQQFDPQQPPSQSPPPQV